MFRLFEKIKKKEIYVIAEMSANHNGSLDNALELVRIAADVGADCIKTQTYKADTMTLDCNTDLFKIQNGLWEGYKLYDLYKDANTPWEWQKQIKKECEYYGIDFFSTVFDMSSVDYLEKIGCEAYKIASFELVDIPLIEYVASKKKPVVISCGMGTLEEIKKAVDTCVRVGNHQIVLLYCSSEYPTPWDSMHLANIQQLAKVFSLPIGFSDHSIGYTGDIAAVSLGASVIEKHIKLDSIETLDSAFSLSPDDFSTMVENVRITKRIIDGPNFSLTPGELESRKYRRSLFAVEDIKQGEIVTDKNVRSIRPADGLEPELLSIIIGKSAKRYIPRGTPIKLEFFDEEMEK